MLFVGDAVLQVSEIFVLVLHLVYLTDAVGKSLEELICGMCRYDTFYLILQVNGINVENATHEEVVSVN